MHESSVNPAPTPRTALLSGSGRPNDPFKHLQYVDLTLDDEGKCHLKPPRPRTADIAFDNKDTMTCRWEPDSKTVLAVPDSNFTNRLRKRRQWPGWGLEWQAWVKGTSKTGPGPKLRLRLADSLTADMRNIVSRLAPRPMGGTKVSMESCAP